MVPLKAIFPLLGRRSRTAGLVLACAGALAGCVRERALFEELSAAGTEADDGSNAGDGGAPAVGGKGNGGANVIWEAATCVAALSQGKNGDACVGGFKCSANANCCEIAAVCEANQLALKSACDVCSVSCTGDADCGAGRLCEAYECRDCRAGACPASWLTVVRNGCSVCVPPSQCNSGKGASCAGEQICVAGLSCLPGCKGDPACCFGNQCAPASCATPPDAADCLDVGCPAGMTCHVVAEAATCSCDAVIGKWSCEQPPLNSCVVDDKP